jgi:hypothetical protein
MLGAKPTTDSVSRFYESRFGAEHWVGGISEFARLWNEQDPYPHKRGESAQADEDDI